jgi:hypothetical protein
MDIKKFLTDDNLALGFFGIAALIAVGRGYSHAILAGLAVTFIIFGLLPKHRILAYLAGALTIAMAQRYASTMEGFADVSGGAAVVAAVVAADDEKKEAEDETEASEEEEKKAIVKQDPVVLATEKKASEKFSGSKKKVMLPDNATRREPLELGKPYTLPSENDDKGYHLDAGTTFLNAYKALKPDQIAAMTRDTQDLLATQKSLVGMLESFGPLMKDMKSITGIFGSSSS